MKSLFLVLLLSCISAFSAEFNSVINCRKLTDSGSCKMRTEGSKFLKVNSRPISYYSSPTCQRSNCDWMGKTSSYDLIIGQNKFDFQVATSTSNAAFRTTDFFTFYFNGQKRHEYRSERTGTSLDTASFQFDLELKDIDADLYARYREYQRQARERSQMGKEYDREINNLQKKLDDAYSKLMYLDQLYSTFITQTTRFEDINPDMLKELGLSPEYIESVKSIGQGFEEIYAKADEGVRNFEDTQRANQESLKKELALYNIELPDAIVESEDLGKENPQNAELKRLLSDIDNDKLAIETAIRNKDADALTLALDEFQLKFELTKEVYAHSNDLSASDKILILEKQAETYQFLLKNKISPDGWVNSNNVSPESRKYIDQQVLRSNSNLTNVKQSLMLSTIPEESKQVVDRIIQKSSQLERKINEVSEDTVIKKVNKGLAKSALELTHEKLARGIKDNNKEMLEEAEDSVSFGLMILDFGLDLIPGISSAKSAYALATGENIVTGATLSELEKSLEFVGLFVGLVGAKPLVSGGSKVIETISQIYKKSEKILSKVVNDSTAKIMTAASKLGLTKFDEIYDFIQTVNGATGKNFDLLDNYLDDYIRSKALGAGPRLTNRVHDSFKNFKYYNRRLSVDEIFYKYHGIDNRTGNKVSWVVKTTYSSELDLRSKLAILPEWKQIITSRSKFKVPAGTWVSEGLAGIQHGKLSTLDGGDYQAVISNIPVAWIQETVEAFK